MNSLSRYSRTQNLLASYFASKQALFTNQNWPKVTVVNVQAGLYKMNSILPEHGLILSNISGKPTQLCFQLHGKRQRRTIALATKLGGQQVWQVIDKLVHELIPHMQDFITPKHKKNKNHTNTHTLRFRQKLTAVEDFDELVENSMHDSHKGIYLPFTVHFQLNTAISSTMLETYLRMLRLPIILFKRKARPAFDDKVVFASPELLAQQVVIVKKKK